MRRFQIVTMVASAVLIAALAGCGGGGSSNTSSSPAAAPTATSVIQGEQNALPLAVAAKIPPGLKCSSTDIVWVNIHRKTFHDPGDPWYGKTKNGAYMCRSDAIAQGDRPAGSRHAHMGSQPETQMQSTMAPSEAPTPGHRRHRHSSS